MRILSDTHCMNETLLLTLMVNAHTRVDKEQRRLYAFVVILDLYLIFVVVSMF